ncbi:MAG: dUTP pyrophosphatase [SAR324 cluster bacterium]|nr:dUTP pyrophosphatase [SAR324 cluster bacterium]
MKPPERAHNSDSGLDLTLMKVIEKRDSVYFFDTGVSIEAPPGYYTELFARSSIYKHDFVMVNGVGVIDAEYRGTLFMPMRYLGSGDGKAAAESLVGQRIGQLVLRRIEPYQIEFVSELSNTVRGDGGFGSSGS